MAASFKRRPTWAYEEWLPYHISVHTWTINMCAKFHSFNTKWTIFFSLVRWTMNLGKDMCLWM